MLEKCQADLARHKVLTCKGVQATVDGAKDILAKNRAWKDQRQQWFDKHCR